MRCAARPVRTYATVKVAGGQYLLPEHGRFGLVMKPSRLEDFELRPHQNPQLDRDWPAEIRGYYRDLLKSISIMKQRFRVPLPNDVVRQNIRRRFEQGTKLTDPAAIRHRALMVSADLEDYFRENMLDTMHIQGKYNNRDSQAMLKQDLKQAAVETQAAHRFFTEGTNILLETGIGPEDVTENRVYMTREQAYRKGLASLKGEAALEHLRPALDKANQHTLEALAGERDVQALVDLLATMPGAKDAEAFLARGEAFLQAAGLEHHRASGGAVLVAWESFKDEEANAAVLMHPAYQALRVDPRRNPWVRGPADMVRLANAAADSPSASTQLRVAQHLYLSDQLPEGYAEDLGAGYLADLKGVDRRMDLLLDEEIAYRQELLLRVAAGTVTAMRAVGPSGADVGALRRHLDSFDWAAFVVPAQVAVEGYPLLSL